MSFQMVIQKFEILKVSPIITFKRRMSAVQETSPGFPDGITIGQSSKIFFLNLEWSERF
jgi:hypothetical protein